MFDGSLDRGKSATWVEGASYLGHRAAVKAYRENAEGGNRWTPAA